MIRIARMAFFGLALLAGWHVFFSVERKVALVIAASDYRFAPAIAGTSEPMAAIARQLELRGYIVTQVTNPDRRALRTTLSEFVQSADGATDAAFVFSGYAIQADGANYLAPIDAAIWAAGDLAHEVMPLEPVVTALHERARRATIVLDAARDHPFAATLREASPRLTVGNGLAPIAAEDHVTVALAAAPGALASRADSAGRNVPNAFLTSIAGALEDPELTLPLALKSARAVVIAETNGRQVPWDSASLVGQMVTGPLATPNRVAHFGGAGNQTAEPPIMLLGSAIVPVSDAKPIASAHEEAETAGPSWFAQVKKALRESALLGGSRARETRPADNAGEDAEEPAKAGAPAQLNAAKEQDALAPGQSLSGMARQIGEPVATLNLSQGSGSVLHRPAAPERDAARVRGMSEKAAIGQKQSGEDQQTTVASQGTSPARTQPTEAIASKPEAVSPPKRTEQNASHQGGITVRGITVQAAALGNLPKASTPPRAPLVTQAGLPRTREIQAAIHPQDPIVVEALASGQRRPLRLALQTELVRRGCYAGTIDGVWGHRSRRALQDLATLHSAPLPDRRPSVSLLQYLVDRPALTCVTGCATTSGLTEDARCQVAQSRPTSANLAAVGAGVAAVAGIKSANSPALNQAASGASGDDGTTQRTEPQPPAKRQAVARDYLPRSKPKGAMALGMVPGRPAPPARDAASRNGPTVIIGNKVYRMKRTAGTLRAPVAVDVRAVRQANKWRKQVRLRRLYREAFGFEPIR